VSRQFDYIPVFIHFCLSVSLVNVVCVCHVSFCLSMCMFLLSVLHLFTTCVSSVCLSISLVRVMCVCLSICVNVYTHTIFTLNPKTCVLCMHFLCVSLM